MKNHPILIENAITELAENSIRLQKCREKLDLGEAHLTVEIHLAKDENNKPLYSNEALRKAEFVIRCEKNNTIKHYQTLLLELEQERAHKLAEIERLRLEYKYFLLEMETEIAVRKS